MLVLSFFSCIFTLHDPIDCSPPGTSVHGILQARILEWVAISVSNRSSPPRDRTQVFCITGRFFTSWATKWEQKLCPKTERGMLGVFWGPLHPAETILCSSFPNWYPCCVPTCRICCSLFGGEVCGTSHYGLFTALWSHSDGHLRCFVPRSKCHLLPFALLARVALDEDIADGHGLCPAPCSGVWNGRKL